jgi:hypothetical protein
MKDEKLNIDMLLIVSYILCFFVLFIEYYFEYFENFYDWGLYNITFTQKLKGFLSTLGSWSNNYTLIRLVLVVAFLVTTLGFHVKLSPNEDNKKPLIVAVMFLSILTFVVLPQLKTPLLFNASISILAIIVFVSCFILLRKHFSYFGHEDEFNSKNQEFSQEKKILKNEYSVNFKTDKGYINVVNPFRGTMVLGTPGSGKSYSVIEEYIRQHLMKDFGMLVYDFKYPSLAKETYGFYNYYKKKNKLKTQFNVISLDNIYESSFVNPLSTKFIRRASDALEASQTVLFNLNKEWIEKKDFFAQSAISFFAACIYFLKIFENGKYCTLPHAISLASATDEKIFKVFLEYPELKFFMTPFADALEKGAFEQLSGQTASARVPLSQLGTKELFWVMGNNVYPELNVPLGINDPDDPRILILANSPLTQTTNSPALGLVVTQLLKEINQQNRIPSSVILDELPTMYFMGLDNLIATARSNKISTTIGMQDLEQLKRDYGEKSANTIFNIVGNVFSGAVRSDTASKIQDMIGKKKQKLKNVTVDSGTSSYTINESLEFAIPAGTIANLSQGEFVGVVSDNFGQEIKTKMFRGKIKIDKRTDQIKSDMPKVHSKEEVTDKLIQANYNRIITEIDNLLNNELLKIEERKTSGSEENKL